MEVPDEVGDVVGEIAGDLIDYIMEVVGRAQDREALLEDLLNTVEALACRWARAEARLRQVAKGEKAELHKIAKGLAELAPGAWNRALERWLTLR